LPDDFRHQLPQDALDWSAANADLLDLIVERLLDEGQWPRRADLQRLLVRRSSNPPALGALFDQLPRALGFVQQPDQRIVLTLAGLHLSSRGRVLTEAFVQLLRLATERYSAAESNGEPCIMRADLHDPLGLDVDVAGVLSEVVLREAPFVAGGHGGPDDEWRRDVSEDIVRYWNCKTAEDYLARRAKELSISPMFGWIPSAASPSPGHELATPRVKETEIIEPPPTPQPGAPAGLRIAWSSILALATVVSLVWFTPLWVTATVLASAGAIGAVWWRGFVWPPRPRAILVIIGAAAVAGSVAYALSRDSAASTTDRAAAPVRQVAIVDRYVQVTKRAVQWVNPPTIYEPSASFMRSHLAWFDPDHPHKFDFGRIDIRTDVGSLAVRGPEMAGAMLDVVGTLAQTPTLIGVFADAENWAFFLRQPKTPRLLAVCRVPIKPGEENGYRIGDVVHATGVLLADGAIERIDGRGQERLSYIACSAIGRREAIITLGGRRKHRP
jgi:hypothetical protein